MNNQKTRSVLLRLPFLFFNLLLFGYLFVGGSHAFAQRPPDLDKSIGFFSEYKSNGEGLASKLVEMKHCKSITKKLFDKGEILYIDAKAGFDGLIDQLVIEIKSGNTEVLSSTYEDSQKSAKTKAEKFITFVHNPYEEPVRGESANKIIKVFETLKRVGSLLKNGFINADKLTQSEIIKELEQYKWSKFETIQRDCPEPP